MYNLSKISKYSININETIWIRHAHENVKTQFRKWVTDFKQWIEIFSLKWIGFLFWFSFCIVFLSDISEQMKLTFEPSLSMKILSINNFTTNLLSKLFSDLSIILKLIEK